MGIIYKDNIGAMFLVESQQVGPRMKHIDIRHHHIRGLKEDGWLQVKFIKSKNNAADILNKNAVEWLPTKHATNIRQGTIECWREGVVNTGNNSQCKQAQITAVITVRDSMPAKSYYEMVQQSKSSQTGNKTNRRTKTAKRIKWFKGKTNKSTTICKGQGRGKLWDAQDDYNERDRYGQEWNIVAQQMGSQVERKTYTVDATWADIAATRG